jgi:gluconate 2-dehydrogenase gamma chain
VSDAQNPVQISRRDALKGMGAASMAGMAGMAGMATMSGVLSPEAERLTKFMEGVAEEQQQGQAYVPKFFTAREWRTVRMLADYVIPRDERSGSATEAKVPEYMDFILLDFVTSDAQRVSFRGGLNWLENECRRRFDGRAFTAATDAERRQVLDDIAYPRRAKPEHAVGVAFFSRFRDMVASGFWSSQVGWQDLKYMGHVFNPNWQGCPKPALDKLGVSYDLMNSFVRPDKP